MANTQRDERNGRADGGSADRPDRGRRSGCRPGCRGGWRARRDGGQEPQRPRLFGPRFWLLLLGLLDDLPFPPTGTGPARCGRLQAPRGAPAAIGGRFGQAIVRQAIKSSRQISGKRRSKVLGPVTGRGLDPA
jgi:hypothetical protein